ncbi:large ribosomal subunit protein mL52-like [Patagioenas fasciata]|uniref:large ribosomal subunit protein mL52-like n=1 Tax=Patagioenas fasciata TaxID=372321 RepID=UPI003A9A5AC0
MAARRVLRLGERHVRNLRPLPRPPQRIGQWRVEHGLSPGSSGFGPLRDLPDWSFVDGRPAPLWKGQQRRLRENEELARRAVGLIGALDAAASRGRPTGVPAPQLRPKGSQRPPGRSGTDQ